MRYVKWIALALSLVLLMGTMSACQQKTPQTAEGFTDLMEAAGMTVKDPRPQHNFCYVGTPLDVLTASDDRYTIYFYETPDNLDSKKLFDIYENMWETHSLRTMQTSESFDLFGTEYNYLSFNHDGMFHVISRINHTLIMCEADAQYQSEIMELFETLGYK
jgi:hypothetical protein